MVKNSFWTSGRAIPALFLIGAASYFLLVEHRQHLFQWLPFLIIALCPLMHIFMHGGHGHGHGEQQPQNKQNRDYEPDSEEDRAYRRGLEEGRNTSSHHH